MPEDGRLQPSPSGPTGRIEFFRCAKISGPEISGGPALHLPQPIMALGPWLAIWLPLTKFPAAYYPIGQVSRKRRA
jgi:hypothetical protein